MFSSRLLTHLAALLTLAPVLAAQSPRLAVVPRVGQTVRIRVVDGGSRVNGRVIRMGPDSMVLATGRDTLVLSSSLLDAGHVTTDTRPAIGKGAAIGAAVGLLVGLTAGLAEECTDCFMEVTPAAAAFAGMGIGGIVGALIGAAGSEPIWSRAAAPGKGSGPFNGDLGPGDAVRLVGLDRKPVGVVAGGTGDTVIVRLESGADTVVGLGSVERYTGSHANAGKGAIYGAVAGALSGIIMFAVQGNDEFSNPPSAGQAVAGTVLLSFVGATVGSLTGSKTRPSWTPVATPQPRALTISPILRPHRVGVMVRLAW
jgi:hypothetical protein